MLVFQFLLDKFCLAYYSIATFEVRISGVSYDTERDCGVRKSIIIFGGALLILIAFAGCTKNKFKLTRPEPEDIPFYNPTNDTCFICHNVSTLKKTILTSLGSEVVPLYVNRDKFARSLHRAQRCQACHTDIVLHKGHGAVPKSYGGWANFSAEDTLLTRNYTTQASIACPACHGRSSFLDSPHYLIEKIKASREKINQANGVHIGKEYDQAKCGKCHLTCATCHFKGTRIQQTAGEVTDWWSQLLNGQTLDDPEGQTNWQIDWTTNVESHDFAGAEELEESNDLCRMCHTGYYTSYSTTGYYPVDTVGNYQSLVSQGIQKYPKFEEWRFLSGNITVMTGTNQTLDSLYGEVRNPPHSSRLCLECHSSIHSLRRISCLNCHDDKEFSPGSLHSDVGCEACHDATMSAWRKEYRVFPPADTVRTAAVRDNEVIDWRSHMLIRPDGENSDFCDRKCHNPVVGPIVGAPSYSRTGTIH